MGKHEGIITSQDHHLPSGYCKTLNEQQEIELNKLADKVKDVSYVMNHPSGEAFLLRFLRATMDKKVSYFALYLPSSDSSIEDG